MCPCGPMPEDLGAAQLIGQASGFISHVLLATTPIITNYYPRIAPHPCIMHNLPILAACVIWGQQWNRAAVRQVIKGIKGVQAKQGSTPRTRFPITPMILLKLREFGSSTPDLLTICYGLQCAYAFLIFCDVAKLLYHLQQLMTPEPICHSGTLP